MASTHIPAPGEILCPDPSAHDHTKRGPSSAASKAALLVTKDRNSGPASRRSVDSADSRPSSNHAAQHNLKYAKAQDLPSFPSRGSTSSAAFAAAVLAKDYSMKELWQPEASVAGSKAAAMAHKDGGNVDLWHPSASAAGNSAAAIAMRNKDLSPELDRGYTTTGQSNSMLAAAKSASMGRQRAGSTPAPPPPSYPDAQNSSRNALNAATVSHRTSTRIEIRSDGWDSEAMQAARIQNVGSRMDREMFGEHPPVEPELEEARQKAALRASAVSMAKSMYEHQRRAPTPSDTSSVLGSAGRGAEVAHRRNKSSTSQADIRDEAMRYIHLQDAAHRIAQERLAKMEQDIDGSKYREYYGYGEKSPRKSRTSTRRRKRASSEGQYASDSDDEVQARRIRSQMSQLSTAQKSVTDKQRQDDRARLLAAAEKRVQARMHDMDEQVFLETGKVSQAMMDDWEKKAHEKAERDKQERDRDAPAGKTHIGGGKYMDKVDIEAIAAARLKSTFDELDENAERMRARDAEIERRKDEAETARMQEKMEGQRKKEEAQAAREQEKTRERQQKAEMEASRNAEKAKEREQKMEFKRIKEQDKATAKKERAEREALARKEKQDREMAARREREDRKAKEKADKDDAKARVAEENRKSRDSRREFLYTLAGGAAVGEEAEAVDEDKEREEKREERSREAGADALADVAQKVREDKAKEEMRDQEAVVAGGVALGEVADKVKADKEREEWRDAQAKLAGSDALAKVAVNVKHDQAREEKRETEAVVAGGAALGEVADKVKQDREEEEWRDSQAKIAGSDALAKVATNLKQEQAKEEERNRKEAEKEAAATVAGGAALGEVAEKVRRDREAEQQLYLEQRSKRDTWQSTEVAGAGAAAAVLGATEAAAYETKEDEDHTEAAQEPATVARRYTGPAPNTIGPHKTDIANVLDPRVKPDAEKQKEDQPLTFGPHRSDIANILDPRVDSSRPTTAENSAVDETRNERSEGTEAFAAVGAGAVAGGAATVVAEDETEKNQQPAKLTKGRDQSKQQPKEQPKEKRNSMFSKLSKRLKSRDGDKPRPTSSARSEDTSKKSAVDDEPGAEAADGAVAAGIPVAPLALAAAGGTDEARGDGEVDDVKDTTEPHAADGSVAAGTTVATVALAAAGGTDEARGESDFHATRDAEDHAAEDSDDDIDRSKAAEALMGVGAVGVIAAGAVAGVAATLTGQTREEEETRADVSSLDSTEDETGRESLRQYTTAEHSGHHNFASSSLPVPARPDFERHISTIESSSGSDYEEDDEDDTERYDYEDSAGISRVTADSPDSGKYWRQVHVPDANSNTVSQRYETESGPSPVSPLDPKDEVVVTRADASARDPDVVVASASSETSPRPTKEELTAAIQRETSRRDKGKKGVKGFLSKLTGKSEHKLHKQSRTSNDEEASVQSADAADAVGNTTTITTVSGMNTTTATTTATTTSAFATAAPAITTFDTGREDEKSDGVVAPVTTTSTGVSEQRGLFSRPVGSALQDPPDSPSSFTRHEDPASKDLDEVSSSGAEEEDMQRGRGGRLVRKLGLFKGKGKEAESKADVPASPTDDMTTNGEDDQFEEAQDHFDESLAPPPAFAGQARHSSDSPVRGTRFQEEL